MKKLVTFLVSVYCIFFSLNGLSANGPSAIENIKWLLGTWEMTTPRGSIYETWVLKDSMELSGKSYTIKGSDTIVSETVRIIEKEGKILYIPSVSDQNEGDPVVFESSFISRSKFIVENPEHDFPKVITYTRTGMDELVAEISGPSRDGHTSYMTFPMKRIPNVISKNIALVESVFQFFNAHDWTQMAGLYSDPAKFKDPEFGTEMVLKSTDEIINKYQEMNDRFPDIHDEIVAIYPSGEKHVIVEFISSGTASNGLKWQLPLVTIFTISNNLIVKEFTYYDK